MKEVKRIKQLGNDWEGWRKQADKARYHPLGFLWMWYLNLQVEKAKIKYKAEERYLTQQTYERSRRPFSGIHG